MQMNFKYILLFFLVFSSSLSIADPLKSALKDLEKGKYEKVEQRLTKYLEKDTLNPGARYIFSLLYVKEDYDAYSVDTANIYIIQALAEYPLIEEKKLKKLLKINITQDALYEHKAFVDSLGYSLAVEENTIAEFNEFLENHPEADEVPKAIKRRNDLAFEKASKINTYEAFMKFIQTYPDADQVRDAKELYDILVFEKLTQDKKLSSYINFLKEHPKTPYRSQAEKQIFEISTAGNNPSDYVYLLRNFPLSKYSRRAVSYLFHNYKEIQAKDTFLLKYPDVPYKDSIAAVIDVEKYALFPIYEQEKYGFMDTQGKMILEPSFKAIPEDYSCRAIYEDYLIVENPDKKIIGRNNKVIHQDTFDKVQDLGHGLLKIHKDDQYLLKHKGGFDVLDSLYDDISILAKKFILIKTGDKTGIACFNGRVLYEPQFDEVFTEGGFIVLDKAGLLAVTNANQLAEKANNVPLELNFKFEEVNLEKNNNLHAIGEDFEVLLSPDMKVVIPEDNHHIISYKSGWVLNKGNAFKLYDEQLMPVSQETYDQAISSKNWLALKKGEKWGVINNKTSFFPEFIYDSLQILTSNITLLFNEAEQVAMFENGETVPVNPVLDKIQILKPTIMTGSEDTTANEYLMLTNKNNFRKVYNTEGKEIINGFYDNISYLGPNLLLLDKSNRKGLADGTGKIILPVKYTGIGNYNNGYVSTLTGTKFGLFNPLLSLNIKPQYETSIQTYNDNLLLATQKQKIGFIDLGGKKITGFMFDEVHFWNDSTALVKNKGSWNLYGIYKNEIEYDAIEDIKYVRQDSAESIILIIKNNNYGVLSSIRGEVIPPLYTDIVNLGSPEEPVYFSEKNVEEALIFIAIYFNDKGEMIRRQAFTPEEYEKIYCE